MSGERPTNHSTLCLFIDNGKLLLGMKKRGFGVGKFNGYGGKVQAGETVQQAALREFIEESCLNASLHDLDKMGEIDFHFPHKPEWDQTVHIFLVKSAQGNPQETEEMGFEWFPLDDIPYAHMWDDDKHWLPYILDGKRIIAKFTFKEVGKENLVDRKEIDEVNSF